MKYRLLGNSGLKVSALGLGTNAFGKRADANTSKAIIHYALDHGITFIDTANIYAGTESEKIIGDALKGRRHEAVLTTKAGLPRGPGPYERGSSRRHLTLELEQSLKRLGTDYVDLYQIHTFDPETPLEETLRTLENMIQSGKVRYIGASNYYAWELMKAVGISDRLGLNRFVSMQTSYSLADRTPERELIPMCVDQGIGIIPYFPLAGGILTGKYSASQGAPVDSRAITDPNFQRFLSKERIQFGSQVGQMASRLESTASALSLAWLMQQPQVCTVIVGATTVEQLRDNLNSNILELDAATLAELNQLSEQFRHGDPFAIYRLS
ncbi:aldo/keto reductase [Paenibacillus sp. L3-i20]|uniref:aldo/keto reductase n=1 Tax=Paenibacillus sp. L3-i20 TaxID=2905833 RepID=UPI001EDDFEB6|nr:aldo/keto reductase [Paenibacillus sp. L3-i20]GKU76291.1 oxidoreductase [Paenibacillus sp. L3-i20]